MRRFDEWRERYQFALLLPMHCRKPREAASLSPHDLFGSSAWQWGAEMLLGVERKSESMTWLHWWKDREGEVAEDGAAVGTHWDIKFDREKGFRRYAPKTGAPKFDLGEFIYEAIRINGPMTREEIKNLLWAKRRSPDHGADRPGAEEARRAGRDPRRRPAGEGPPVHAARRPPRTE